MRRGLFCVSILLMVTFSGAMAAPRPNIVIILADDMGYGDPSCYNPDGNIKTPHIDALAERGMRFLDAHAGGSYCIPSRYALMTGRFAARASMAMGNGPLIEEGRVTVPSMLRANGYRTAMVGKWHLGFDQRIIGNRDVDYSRELKGGPVDCGFDSFFGMHASLDIPPYFFIKDRRAVMPPTEKIEANDSKGTEADWNGIQGAFWRAGQISPDFKMEEVTPRLVAESVKVIKEHGAAKQDKPLFLYLALPSPHTPWLPAREFLGKSGAGMYGDFVMQVDSSVGEILESLKSAGMDKNTMVLFTSDNGPVWYDKNCEKFGHNATGVLRGMKFSAHEGGHRMPFIVSWPGRVDAGAICGQTIEFCDVLATFADVVGQKAVPPGMAEDSVSFLAYLLKADKPPQKRAPIIHHKGAIRDGDWKYIPARSKNEKKEHPDGELYNLKDDLAEKNNLVLKNPEMAQRLSKKLESFPRK